MATKTKKKITTLQVCDACGKNEDDVKKMLLLPNYNLCNECIGLASELVEEENIEITSDHIKIPGYHKNIVFDKNNPWEDMC